MKKYLSLFFILAITLSLFACASDSAIIFPIPDNGIFDAPEKFYYKWDIPNVRDASLQKDGYYSMPVYMFETYQQLLHLKEITGMNDIGNEMDNLGYCNVCLSQTHYDDHKYNKEFFDNYTLLIGWHQYDGVVLGTHVQQNSNDNAAPDSEGNNTNNTENNKNVYIATYEIGADGSLVVYLQGEKASSDTNTKQQWVLVAVPKNVIADCNSIAFFVQLPIEQ